MQLVQPAAPNMGANGKNSSEDVRGSVSMDSTKSINDTLMQTLFDAQVGSTSTFQMRDFVQSDVDQRPRTSTTEQQRLVRIRIFHSRWAFFIDLLMLINVSCTMVIAPFTFIYDGYFWQQGEDDGMIKRGTVPGGYALLGVDLTMDFLYAVYLWLVLDMSFMHPTHRTEVVASHKVVRYHLRSPIYVLKWLSAVTYIGPILLKWPLFWNVIKLIRADVFMQLPDSFWKIQDLKWIRLMRPIILLIGLAHWVGCLLFAFGGLLDVLDQDVQGIACVETYVRGYTQGEIDGRLSCYVEAFVEAIYMLTGSLDNPTGQGGYRESNFFALVIVAVFAPVGPLVVSLFIAAIVQERNLHNALDTSHRQKQAFVQRAVEILRIPENLRQRVFSLHQFQKISHDQVALLHLFDENHLSSSLKIALQISLYQNSVLSSPYFACKDANYVIEVMKILREEVYVPGDYVARRGEIASCMYFVARGKLAVLVPGTVCANDVGMAIEVSQLESGSYFGEVALVKDCVRTAWIRANTFTLLASLERSKLEPIWKYFPEERYEMEAQVEQIAMKDKQRNENQAKADDQEGVENEEKPKLAPRSSRLRALEDTSRKTSRDCAEMTASEESSVSLEDVLRRQASIEALLARLLSALEPLGVHPADSGAEMPASTSPVEPANDERLQRHVECGKSSL